MEENKQDLQESTFIKKYVKEIPLESPSRNFTSNIMDILVQEEKQVALQSEPLISMKIWLAVASFVVMCLIAVLQKGTSLGLEIPRFKTNFLSKIQLPNVFDSLSVSSTMLYSVMLFTLLAFVQMAYLKNHFNKRFN
jgi:hypothetical protein